MQKYEVLCKAGSGNFSDVYKARNRLTDEVVAIKQMKHSQDLEELTYKELQILATLNHPNIIKVKQIIRQKGDIKVVFEYMDETLLELYQSSKLGINQNQIRCILFQAAFALDYLHRQKFIHRDIKPENLLINRKIALIKLIDFGLAKQDYLASTDYVATRWYRAPENLLGLKNSSTAMDIFALGCVIVQLFTLNPLFPGDDTLDQLNKVVDILGPPTNLNWPQGYKQAQRKGIVFTSKSPIGIRHCIPTASNELINLIQQMLHLNPMRRVTARQILNHPFFQKVQRVIPEYIYKQVKKSKQEYESKKARKVSPLHYSPKHQINRIGNFQHNKYLNLHTPVKQNEKSRDSKLSIQKRIHKQPSSKVETKSHNIHTTPQTINNKNYSPINNGFNSNRKQMYSNLSIHDQIVRNKSKDYSHLVSNSVQKRSFDNRLHQNVQKATTLNDQKYYNRNTLEIKQNKQDIRSSPRFNIKYFKQPQSNTHQDRRNIAVSLEPSFLSRNRVLQNNMYPSNNFNQRY